MPRTKRENARKQQQLPQQSSKSSLRDAELALEQAQRLVEDIDTQEYQRALRIETELVLADLENTVVQMYRETEIKDDALRKADQWRQLYEAVGDDLEHVRLNLNARSRECDDLRAQLQASEASNSNASNLLFEKLALSRENADMRAEVDHLRSQVSANSGLLSEKLSLQGQLDDTQAELEDSRRQLRRCQKREVKKDEATRQCFGEMQTELETIRQVQINAEKERDQAMADSVHAARAECHEELRAIHNTLAKERKDRQKLEKAHINESQGWQAEKTLLDDKLAQFRTKLKSTKQTLSATEAELETVRTDAFRRSAPSTKAVNPRKRKASQSTDPDATIGTPGDGDANKRVKRASSVVGEKSTFSITPFLARTASVQPEGADEPIASVEDSSPSMRQTANILVPSGAGKANLKTKSIAPARKRSVAAATTLEQVEEEEDVSNDENTVPISVKDGGKQETADAKPSKPILKPRKSLANFASFREGSLQPRPRLSSVEPGTKKKRRLLGSAAGKTLMDDDEDDEAAGGSTGAFGAKTLFGSGVQRAFGAVGKTAGGFGGGSMGKRKGPLQTADGFAFSPLKKERRAMAAASRAASEAPAS